MVSRRVLVIKLIVYVSDMVMLNDVARKMVVVRAFIMIIFMYSARKNRANEPAAYSILKPETSSDSPSVRSKGARLVSGIKGRNHCTWPSCSLLNTILTVKTRKVVSVLEGQFLLNVIVFVPL